MTQQPSQLKLKSCRWVCQFISNINVQFKWPLKCQDCVKTSVYGAIYYYHGKQSLNVFGSIQVRSSITFWRLRNHAVQTWRCMLPSLTPRNLSFKKTQRNFGKSYMKVCEQNMQTLLEVSWNTGRFLTLHVIFQFCSYFGWLDWSQALSRFIYLFIYLACLLLTAH